MRTQTVAMETTYRQVGGGVSRNETGLQSMSLSSKHEFELKCVMAGNKISRILDIKCACVTKSQSFISGCKTVTQCGHKRNSAY